MVSGVAETVTVGSLSAVNSKFSCVIPVMEMELPPTVALPVSFHAEAV